MIDPQSLSLAIRQRTRINTKGLKRAAVLVPLICDGGEERLLLTRRTDDLSTHRGQVAFPGGRQDPSDTDFVDTALREAEEEVALPRDRVEVIGPLDDFPTVTGDTMVTPVVGVMTDLPPLVPEASEVARIFDIPIAELTVADRWTTREWNEGATRHPIYYFEWDGETLWGLSAYITLQLLSLLPGGSPIKLPPPYDR